MRRNVFTTIVSGLFYLLLVVVDIGMPFQPENFNHCITTHNDVSKRIRRSSSSFQLAKLKDDKSDSDSNNITVLQKKYVSSATMGSKLRRKMLSTALQIAITISSIWTIPSTVATAATPVLTTLDAVVKRPIPTTSIYKLVPERNITSSQAFTSLLEANLPAFNDLSSELCLLRLLPVKNEFFRQLQGLIEGLSRLRTIGSPDRSTDIWAQESLKITKGVGELDKKRNLLRPIFNPDEDTLMQITKGERFETLIESLRSKLVDISISTAKVNATETFIKQKSALLTLSEIGELLVAQFPYKIPTEGKFSYLPRLMGRCSVTMSFRRRKSNLGNITIIADGFSAPITAGNFVDLCARGFYTGLPIKFQKKRVGTGSVFDVANLLLLGSYNDGFHDPLTAKLRRLPLEILRVPKSNPSELDLTYSQGLYSLSESCGAVLEPTSNSRPLLSFQIPGLVAMNHPKDNLNGASSEFFAIQVDGMLEDRRQLFDGEYAPFGYIISGMDIFQKLQPNDIIEATKVSEYGIQRLVKLRRSSFQEVVQGSGKEAEAIE